VDSGIFKLNMTVKGSASYDSKILRLKVSKANAGFINTTSDLFEKLKVLNREDDDTVMVENPFIFINLGKYLE
jgi:hypothetical protein